MKVLDQWFIVLIFAYWSANHALCTVAVTERNSLGNERTFESNNLEKFEKGAEDRGEVLATLKQDSKGLFLSKAVDPGNVYVQEITDPKQLEKWGSRYERNLVMFYSAECGHCQEYAPNWRELAKLVAHENSRLDEEKYGIIAVNCDFMRTLCTRYDVQEVPTIILFEGVPKNLGGEQIKDEDINNLLLRLGIFKRDSEPVIDTTRRIRDGNIKATDSFSSTFTRSQLKEELKKDLVLALQCGFEQGVFLGREVVEGKELVGLLEWFQVLSKSFPGSSERASLTEFRYELENLASTGEKIESFRWDPLVAKWRKRMNLAGYNLEEKEYSWNRCAKSKIGKDIHGGYNCALWLLFHTLTVSSATGGANSRDTVSAIMQFIKYFFSCAYCRDHFLKKNEHIQNQIDVYDSKEVILWMWMEHNAVSKRINEYRHSSAENLRKPFPDPILCTSCRVPKPIEEKSSTDYDGIVWNMQSTLKFLIATYCFNDNRLSCTGNQGSISFQDYLFSFAFISFIGCFVLLRYAGKRLNKKLH